MQNFLKVDHFSDFRLNHFSDFRLNHFSDFRLNHFSGFRLISAISETVATMLKNGPFNHSIIKCKKKNS